MYHCHVQNHSDLGMSGIFLVKDEEGRITPDAQRHSTRSMADTTTKRGLAWYLSRARGDIA